MDSIILFLGKTHPLIIHFPIVSIFILLMNELVIMISGKEKKPGTIEKMVFFLFVFSSLYAALSGLSLESSVKYNNEFLETHEDLGLVNIALAIMAAFSYITIIISSKPMIKTYRFFLFLSTIGIAAVSYYGALIHYGPNHFSESSIKFDVINSNKIIFEQDVKPIFDRKCISCHGHYSGNESSLRLSSLKEIVNSGKFGSVVVPGRPNDSPLYKRITLPPTHKDRMPPQFGTLSQLEIKTIHDWIEQFDKNKFSQLLEKNKGNHWSFKKFEKPPVPEVKKREWPINGVDSFLLSKMEKKSVSPLVEESNRALVHARIKYALTGLPLSKTEAAQAKNMSYKHFAKRLTGSKHYGEKWARHWLDLARFADSTGEEDIDRRGSWRYRDYVINSFNKDTPIDQFIIEQLAGDQLPDKSKEVGLGFLIHGPVIFGGSDIQVRYFTWDDYIRTTFKAYLGLDMKCAQCHNHKYESIGQDQYHEVMISFMDIYPDTFEIEDAVELRKETIEKLQKEKKLKDYFEAVKLYEKTGPIYFMNKREDVKTTYIRKRGSIFSKGPTVKFGLPGFFEGVNVDVEFWKKKVLEKYKNIDKKRMNRLVFGVWLTDTENGAGKFVARTMVDHIWNFHFGRDLSESQNNWGVNAKRNKNNDLLDWLTYEFIESGWSLKFLNELIVTSRIYRLKSKKDPENYYASWQKRKKDGEYIRDSILEFANLLDKDIFGVTYRPYLNEEQIRKIAGAEWPKNQNLVKQRRSIYIHLKRGYVFPFFRTLGVPKGDESVSRRSYRNNLGEAFLFFNDPFVHRYAKYISDKFLKQSNYSISKSISSLYNEIYYRDPSEKEIKLALEYINGNKLKLADFVKVLFASNEFAYVN